MKPSRSLTLESVAWAAILAVAAYLRLSSLDARPLDSREAAEVLAAAEGTPEASVFWMVGSQPEATSALYHVLTRTILAIGGSGEGAARIVPALAGLVPLAVVWVFRKKIGRLAALSLGIALSVSPSWVAAARMAGGASLAVAAFAIAASLVFGTDIGVTWHRRAVVGLSIGLGLAAGPAFLTGVVGLFLAWQLAKRVSFLAPSGLSAPAWSRAEWGEVGLWCLVGIAAAASGLGLVPSGISVLFSGWQSWLVGWLRPGLLSVGAALLLFLVYEPLVSLAGLAEGVRSTRRQDPVGRWLAIWAVVALLLFAARFGRASDDILWPLLPLTLAAARFVGREGEKLEALAFPAIAGALTAVLLLLGAFIGIQLSAYASGLGPAVDIAQPGLRLAIAAGALAVAVVVTVLVGFGWDWRAARAGGFAAALLVLLAATISSSWSLNVSGDPDLEVEIWRPSQTATGLQRARDTLQRLAFFETGTRSMAMEASTSLPPNVAWALRGFSEYVPEEVGPGRAPPAVLLPESQPLPRLPAEYLGQSIAVEHAWGWEGAWPPQLLTWWLRRSGPIQSTHWILYVRQDVATLTRPPDTP
jgi:hypothetical protein